VESVDVAMIRPGAARLIDAVFDAVRPDGLKVYDTPEMTHFSSFSLRPSGVNGFTR
jgi:hypothetical protein